MKILHGSEEICGQMRLISKTQRDIGYHSISVIDQETLYKYKGDINLNLEKYNIFLGNIRKIKYFIKKFMNYDVYHFYFGRSLLPYNLDIPMLRALDKKIILQFWGSDIRPITVINTLHKSKKKDIQHLKNLIKLKKNKTLLYFADKVIVASPDLLKFVPNSIYLPMAIDFNMFNPKKNKSRETNSTIQVLHAPTNREIKGTKYVFSTIKQLKREGYDIDLLLIENIPANQIWQYYQKADIVLDQFLIGWHGLVSVEAMAMGKPTLCYISNGLKQFCPKIPILNTTPSSLNKNLKLLIENPELRKKLGKEGKKYVKKVHDPKKIAKRLIELY